MKEKSEQNEFTLDNPPGTEWVLIRSGRAPSEIGTGNEVPKEWLENSTGHIFVKNKETNEWFVYVREKYIFQKTTELWQQWAENVWTEKHVSNSVQLREKTKQLLLNDVFTDDNEVNWSKFFQLFSEFNRTRDEVFPNGTKEMSEDEIYSYILENYGLFLAGGASPLEFPEIIDKELRPLCNAINRTIWGRSSSGCAGHSSKEKMHPSIGYKEPHLEIILDLKNPEANSFIDKAKKLSMEWQEKHKNLNINLREKDIIKIGNKPRLVKFSLMLNVEIPEGSDDKSYFDSEECHQISASFFKELEKIISSIQ